MVMPDAKILSAGRDLLYLPGMNEIDAIRAGIVGDATADELGALPLPASYRGAVVRADEQKMFEGLDSADKDPRKSLHIDDVPTPELAPDEAVVAVMASSINFNTVWTSIFEPLPTFGFLQRLGKESVWGKRHDQPFHVMGSDAAVWAGMIDIHELNRTVRFEFDIACRMRHIKTTSNRMVRMV